MQAFLLNHCAATQAIIVAEKLSFWEILGLSCIKPRRVSIITSEIVFNEVEFTLFDQAIAGLYFETKFL